jgi:hypothetical protein
MSEEQKTPDQETQQSSEGVSRRSLFHVLGAVPAAALAARPALAEVNQHHAHLPLPAAAAQAVAPVAPFQRKVFNDQQWRTVHVLCDLIIPADDRSGSATEAGVPEFMDEWISFRSEQDGNQNLAAQILGGLMWLDRESNRLFEKNFADASADQQKQILDRVAWPERAAKEDHAWALFFNRFRDLTVNGFYTSKMGMKDLPYLGNTALTEWKGCDPKVWAVIEERMKNGYKGVAGPELKPWNA